MKLNDVSPPTLAGSTSSGSASVTVSSTAAVAPGMTVSGTGIPASTTVRSVDSATELTLSANATATGSPTLAFALSAPVSLAEAKASLRITFNDQDTLISALIDSAWPLAETVVDRTFTARTFDLKLDEFPCEGFWRYGVIRLPKPPLISVGSITYYDTAGDLQTLDDERYLVLDGTPGLVVPAPGYSWPSTQCRPEAVTVRFAAGYGAAADVPACVKTWCKAHIEHWYRNRSVVAETFGTYPVIPTFDALLAPVNWGGGYG